MKDMIQNLNYFNVLHFIKYNICTKKNCLLELILLLHLYFIIIKYTYRIIIIYY